MTAVPEAAATEGAALSTTQRAIWASQRLHPDEPLQNMVHLTHIDGPVDPGRLAAAFAAVVARSDALRTRVVDSGGATTIAIGDAPAPTEVVDVARADAAGWATARASTPIDATARVHDSALLRHEDGTSSWYLALHHVATDATSSARVFDAVSLAYHDEAPAIDSFYDWVADVARSEDARVAAARAHWADREPAPPIGRLHTSGDPAAVAASRTSVDLDDALLAAAADRFGAELRMLSDDLAWTTLLTVATSVYLHRLTGQERFAVGLPVHGRGDARTRGLIGPVMEIFPVDVEVRADDTYASLHKRLARSLLTTLRWAAGGTSPLRPDYQATINVIPRAGIGHFGPHPTTTSWIHPGAAPPAQLLGVQLSPHAAGSVALNVDIQHRAIEPARHRAALDELLGVVRNVLRDPDQPIDARPLATGAERRVAATWGTGDPAVVAPSAITALRDAIADRDDIAVEDAAGTHRGRDLWRRVEQLAAWLRARGVERGVRVAVELPRSTDAVVAVYATLLAGGSYVPIDPDQPALRRKSLAQRAGCAIVLDALPPREELVAAGEAPVADRRPDDEAYLLFTSGSTGEPKGVPILDRGLDAYLEIARTHYVDDVPPVAPLFTALGFDLTVTTLFVPLLCGGRLVVVEATGPLAVSELATRTDLTWMKATPSHLEVLLRLRPSLASLAHLVVGGEAFAAGLARRIVEHAPSVRIFNEYGPTEAVVGCMIHEAQRRPPSDLVEVPIGRPMPGVRLRIVDAAGHDAPVGAPGELLISHPGVTPGYLPAGDGTTVGADAFVVDGGRTWYRSGDLVRLVDDDTAVYLGRIDEQLKVGGIRLDPTEVEHALAMHPGVAATAVRTRASARADGADVLVAWYVPSGDPPGDHALRAHAASLLPDHAIPAAFVVVDELPLTANGKLDTDALPDPDRHRTADSADDAPRTATEAIVLDAHRRSLGTTVGLDTDFFAAGGDSLLALQMLAALTVDLGVELRDAAAFTHRTPRSLAAAIDAGDIAAGHRAGPTRRPAGAAPPMSAREQAMRFEHLVDPTSPRYNVGRTYVVDAEVDVERFRVAVEAVCAAHVPLSWTFGDARRHLDPGEAVRFRTDGSLPSRDRFEHLAHQHYLELFDLDHGPLTRVLVAPLDDGRTGVGLAFHHISIDAGGVDRFWHQVDRAYRTGEVVDPEFDYADHGAWQDGADHTEAAAHWSSPELTTEPAAVSWGTPSDRSDGYVQRPASFGAAALRTAPGTTPFVTTLAALAAIMRRRADGDAIAMAYTASTRDHPGAEDLVGYYLNTLPLCVEVAAADELADVAGACADRLGRDLAHRTYPLANIVADRRRLGLPAPSTSVLLSYEDLEPASLAGSAAEHTINASGTAVTDASFFVMVRGDRVELGLEHRGEVIDADQARRLLDDLDATLVALIDDPHRSVGDLALPSLGRPVTTPYEGEEPGLVLDRIARNVEATPGATAVSGGGVSITYAELWQRAGAVADRLVDAGVTRGDVVGVEASRSPATVVAIIGALRAGAAYVPLDAEHPPELIAHVVGDAGITTVLSTDGWSPVGETVTISVPPPGPSDRGADGPRPTTRADAAPRPEDPAYLVYTSGSTGRPKGVVVSHANIAWSTAARDGAYPHPPERFLLVSSFAFDSSMVGLWWTLCSGGTIVLPRPGEHTDVWALGELMHTHRVTDVLALPSLYELLLAELTPDARAALRTAIVAGEPCRPSVIEAHRAACPHAALHNEYGPTEATVWSHAARVDDIDPALTAAAVPIGSPAPGVTAAVIGADATLVPVGSRGELLIGGPTVAMGYHDRPDLTRERFVAGTELAPWARAPGCPPRWYRTGDLVEQRADGTLLFWGRTDDQVKIRGHRIELGAVEVAALEAGARDACAGVIDAEAGTARLCLWYVGETEATALRTAMASTLPEQAVPTLYVPVAELPRSPNGKVDRRALPAPRVVAASGPTDRVPPRGPSEVLVAEVWADVLGIEDISRDDDFFDLGGDSIVSIQVVSRLRRRGQVVTPRDVFEHPTVAELATRLRTTAPAAASVPVEGDVPLLAIQRWWLDRNLAEPWHWNQAVALRLADGTDLDVLVRALDAVVAHHDQLRAVFTRDADGWRQEIARTAPPVPVIRCDDPDPVALAAHRHQVDTSHDPRTGRLVALGLATTAGVTTAYLSVHHLVIDAVSWGPLLEDWAGAHRRLTAGEAVELPDRTTSYQQWARSLRALAASHDTSWWRNRPVPAPVALPADNVVGRQHVSRVTASAELTSRWLATPRSRDTLLAAAAIALADRLGRDRLELLLEGHGRETQLVEGADLSRTVGWFTTRFPVDVDVTGDERRVLARVRALFDELPDAGIGYGIGRELARDPALTQRPEPDVSFNHLGNLDRSLPLDAPFVESGGLLGPVGPGNDRGERAGLLTWVQGGRLHLELYHLPDDIDPAVAAAVLERVLHTLDGLVRHLVEDGDDADPGAGQEEADDAGRFELAGLDTDQLGQLTQLLRRLDG